MFASNHLGDVLSSPISILAPATLGNNLIATLFNQVFAQAIKEGDLDFLTDNQVLIEVSDIELSFSLRLERGRILRGHPHQDNDLVISAKACDFLSMISREKDPDTLFFQRKIKMQGSTELGLYVKNFLGAFDVQSHWFSAKTDQALQLGQPVLKQLFCRNA